MSQFQSLVGSLLVEEGVLRQHRRAFGQWLDCYMLALYREPCAALAARTLPAGSSLLTSLAELERGGHDH